MVFVLAVMALGTLIGALRVQERGFRIFLLCCCALNVAAIVMMLTKNDPYAFRLKPSSGWSEPVYRR